MITTSFSLFVYLVLSSRDDVGTGRSFSLYKVPLESRGGGFSRSSDGVWMAVLHCGVPSSSRSVAVYCRCVWVLHLLACNTHKGHFSFIK